MTTHLYFRLELLAIAVAGTLALAAPAMAVTEIRATLEVTDLATNPIATIQVGEDFLLRAIVQDVRDPEPQFSGVFAAYLNVAFDPAVAIIEPGTMIEHDPFFNLLGTGDVSMPGQILTAGGATLSLEIPGNDPQLLWTVVVHASAAGTTTFVPSYHDDMFYEWLLYGAPDDYRIPEENVEFIGASITVVPEPSSLALAGVAFVGLAATFAGSRRRNAQHER